VLRDERDPRFPRVAGPGEPDGPPCAEDLAGVGGNAPRRDRDERRLAGSVLAEERVDLAGKDREICF
jgi:hypothetical protein